MVVNNNDIITEETKDNLIYRTGWITVLPVGIWYMFNFLFNVGALYFYGINSGYTSMKIEIDFFSLISTGCFFLIYFVFLYNIFKEKVRLYKILFASTIFFVTMIIVLFNTIVGLAVGGFVLFLFLFFVKKGSFRNLSVYQKNFIILSSFVSLVVLSFSSGYFYSKRFADYYCIKSTINQDAMKVLVARTSESTGVFVEAYNVGENEFNKMKYQLQSLVDLELKKCDVRED